MAGVREVYRRYELLMNNLKSIAENSVDETKPDYIESQKDQLIQGSNSSGGTFRKYRNAVYAKRKNQMNPLPGYGNPDLKLTGDFYSGIYAKVEGGKIVIGSNDSKAQALEANYKNVFGLNSQEMEDYLYNKLKPAYHKNIIDFLKNSNA
jgi:hypothetical protein